VREALKSALVEARNPVLVFPEGTARESGPPLPFKHGSLLSAYSLNVPVQPVSLWYSESIGLSLTADTLSQLSNMVRFPMQCALKVGALIFPSDFDDAQAFADAIEKEINRNYVTLDPSL